MNLVAVFVQYGRIYISLIEEYYLNYITFDRVFSIISRFIVCKFEVQVLLSLGWIILQIRNARLKINQVRSLLNTRHFLASQDRSGI